MTKFMLCIIALVVSLASYNTMAIDNIDHVVPICRAVRIANNGESNIKQCLDFNPPFMKGSNHVDDFSVAVLYRCTTERQNQLWILSQEGFIRSLGNSCLVFDPFVNGRNFVTVQDCDKSSQEAKAWKVWHDGTITHVESGQVLTASLAIPHPLVNLEKNTRSPSQVWEIYA